MAWAPGSRWVGVGSSGGGGGGGSGVGVGYVTWRPGSGGTGPYVYELASDAINAINATGGQGVIACDDRVIGAPMELDPACDGLEIGNIRWTSAQSSIGFIPSLVWPAGVETTGVLSFDFLNVSFQGGTHRLPDFAGVISVGKLAELESQVAGSFIYSATGGIYGIYLAEASRLGDNVLPIVHMNGPSSVFMIVTSGSRLSPAAFSEATPGDNEVYPEVADPGVELNYDQPGLALGLRPPSVSPRYGYTCSTQLRVSSAGSTQVPRFVSTVIVDNTVPGDVFLTLLPVQEYGGDGVRITIIAENFKSGLIVQPDGGTINGLPEISINPPDSVGQSVFHLESLDGTNWRCYGQLYPAEAIRPEVSGATITVDADNGSDESGTGDPSRPFLTLARAMIAAGRQTSVIINCLSATTEYVLPANVQDYLSVLIQGDEQQTGGITIGTVVTAVNFTETVLDLLDVASRAADDLKGTQFIDGVTGRRWLCMRSDASSAGPVTRVYCVAVVPTGAGYSAPSAGSGFNILTGPSLNQNNARVDGSLTIRGFQITSGSVIIESGTTRYQNCIYRSSGIPFVVNGQGGVQFSGSYLQPGLPSFVQGMTIVQGGGCLSFIGGNVIDGSIRATNQFITLRAGSVLMTQNNIGIRNFAGFRVRGGTVQPYSDGTAWTAEDTIFLDTTGGTVSRLLALNGGTSVANGGWVMVPLATGQTSSYFVIASFGCKARGQSAYSGSVTTPFGVNSVNANGGAGGVHRAVHPDGTSILGLTPTRTMDAGIFQPVVATPSGAPLTVTAHSFEHVYCDPSSFAVTVNLPLSTSAVAGDCVIVSNDTTSTANSITINGNGANIADPTSPGAYIASVAVSVAGFVGRWRYNGTRWMGF